MYLERRGSRRGRFWLTGSLLLSICLLSSIPAFARDWYVDGVYGSDSNPGTYSQPFQTVWPANSRAQPDDTVYFKPTKTYSSIQISRGGTNGHPVTYAGAGASPNLTKVSGFGSNFGIWIDANYTKVVNFDVTAPGAWSGIFVHEYVHNVLIGDNIVHAAGQDGIDVESADYVTIYNNTVYGNAHVTTYGFGSGISIKGSVDVDSYTGQKMFILGNIVYANTNVPTCYTSWCWQTATDSDGSGIIIDNNRRTTSDNIWYRGGFLIANNVVFGNGGRGIFMNRSDHIEVNSNSVYSNNQDPNEGSWLPGEITGNTVASVQVYNNIMQSDGGEGKNNGAATGTHVPVSFFDCSTGKGGITIAGNIGYRPQNDSSNFLVSQSNSLGVSSYSNIWVNPLFENASLNPQYANFRVKPYSRAIHSGLQSVAMSTDILGVSRYDTSIGAYQNPGP